MGVRFIFVIVDRLNEIKWEWEGISYKAVVADLTCKAQCDFGYFTF